MSKSLGNFFSLSDIFKRFDPRVIRYYLVSQSYRSPLDFSHDNIAAAQNALQGLDDAYLRLLSVSKDEATLKDEDLSELYENFLSALDDDFNSEKALSYLHELKNLILNELFKSGSDRLAQLKKLFLEMFENSLGIKPPEIKSDDDLQALLDQRNAARKSKNWSEADRLRKLIDEKGYKIVDNPDGTSVLMKKI